MEVNSFKPGMFCWTDLATSDATGAKAFYNGLFGWEAEDMPMGEGMFYSMLKKNGRYVGALYHDAQPEMPPHWKIYLSVANAGDAASKAKSLGGSILMEPFDVFDAGRMAVIQDPSGAVFCAWETKSHPGFGVVDEPRAFCWGELNTNDTRKALTFYRQMFNWGIRGNEDGSSEYTEFMADGQSIGGMMAIKK